jgi:hypothetical protein
VSPHNTGLARNITAATAHIVITHKKETNASLALLYVFFM